MIQGSTSGEDALFFLVIAALAACGVWASIRWLLSGPVSPDPWDEQVGVEVSKEETLPLCHRCLLPHDPSVDFCSNCGVAVGQYTNWLPYPYLFSIGHTVRIGTTGDFKHSPLTVGGFLALGLANYSLFFPVYWFVFLRNLFHQSPAQPPEAPASPLSPGL
jgi:hypothetical protein